MRRKSRVCATAAMCLIAGCRCGVCQHPHDHVSREINDHRLKLGCLYCPQLDLTGIGSTTWFNRPMAGSLITPPWAAEAQLPPWSPMPPLAERQPWAKIAPSDGADR